MTTTSRQPRIAAVGSATWDRLIVVERYPAPGECAIEETEISAPGGNTTNAAVALARLGAAVAIAAMVGNDEHGTALRRKLKAEKVDTRWLTTHAGAPTDAATIIVSSEPQNRTIYWLKELASALMRHWTRQPSSTRPPC